MWTQEMRVRMSIDAFLLTVKKPGNTFMSTPRGMTKWIMMCVILDRLGGVAGANNTQIL